MLRERHAEPVRGDTRPPPTLLCVQLLRLRGGDARVVYTEMPRFAGMLRPREYVTCDAAAGREQLFVCKSVAVLEGPLAAAKVQSFVRLAPGPGLLLLVCKSVLALEAPLAAEKVCKE